MTGIKFTKRLDPKMNKTSPKSMSTGSEHVVGLLNAPLLTHQNCGLNAGRSHPIPVR